MYCIFIYSVVDCIWRHVTNS